MLFVRLGRVERALSEMRQSGAEWRSEPAPEPDAAPKDRHESQKAAPINVTVRRRAAALSAEPVPALVPAAEPPEDRPRRLAIPKLDFEDLFGRRLPIWAGGVALAVAGVFLVRFSIERGLITPEVRVAMAFVFGLALLAGAELAYRKEARVADPRVRQALAGAGLATLYAGFYLAGTQYGMFGQTLAFLGLAAVTAAAIGLSFRFGLPSAVLGLIGGFAAPALVGGEDANVPLLTLYLGLVTAGLTLSGSRQQRPWMGIAALIGGLGWGALLLLTAERGSGEVLALGLYLVVLGAVLPALAGAQALDRPVRLAAALATSIQLALLVDQGGYSALAWGLYLLLGGTLAFLAWRRPELREGSAIAAAIGVLLLAQWPAPPPQLFAAVATGLAAVFAFAPLMLVWRGEDRRIDLFQIALVAPALGAVGYATFGGFDDRSEPMLALACAMLAALPLAAAWLLRLRERPVDFAVALASGAVLFWAALLMLTPAWSAPLTALPILAGIAVLAHRRSETPLHNLLWAGATASLLSLFVTPGFLGELGRLAGESGDALVVRGLLRWAAATLPFAATAWTENRGWMRRLAQAVTAVLAYGTLAQVLPADALAWLAALSAIAIHVRLRSWGTAALTLLAIAFLWAMPALFQWTVAGVASLAGNPVFVGELPGIEDVLLRLLPVVAALAAVNVPTRIGQRTVHLRWAAIPLAIVTAHLLYKQLFGIDTAGQFGTFAMAERTLWGAVLLGAAWISAHRLKGFGGARAVGVALAATALAHGVVYSGVLHNPLWTLQAVGSVPIANWILAAGAVAVGAALLLRGQLGERWRPWLDGVVMTLASFTALGLLRQAFAGSFPAQVPLGQGEDLLRSLLGIVLALAFLWLGSRRGERSWRVGSLVLMLVAVVKVFLFDTAGLEGLLRIASFMALGFSLIGIGWVYSRQLRTRPAAEPAMG